MKKTKYILILLFSILVGIIFYYFTNVYGKDSHKNQETTNNSPTVKIDVVYFKVKYGIKLKEDNLFPEKLKNEKKIKSEEEFIEENKLMYLYNLFEVEKNKDLIKKNEIHLYPLDDVELIKTSRYLVDEVFFTSKNISEKIAKRSVSILNDVDLEWTDCLKKLKKIYTGSTYNSEFYSKAISKLIY